MTHRQPYSSLSQFCRAHRLQFLPIPRDEWRLVAMPVLGGVVGLDSYRGLAMATNGIIVAILTSSNEIKFGHLLWFEKDYDQNESDLDTALAEARGIAQVSKKKMECLTEFSELFE